MVSYIFPKSSRVICIILILIKPFSNPSTPMDGALSFWKRPQETKSDWSELHHIPCLLSRRDKWTNYSYSVTEPFNIPTPTMEGYSFQACYIYCTYIWSRGSHPSLPFFICLKNNSCLKEILFWLASHLKYSISAFCPLLVLFLCILVISKGQLVA